MRENNEDENYELPCLYCRKSCGKYSALGEQTTQNYINNPIIKKFTDDGYFWAEELCSDYCLGKWIDVKWFDSVRNSTENA